MNNLEISGVIGAIEWQENIRRYGKLHDIPLIFPDEIINSFDNFMVQPSIIHHGNLLYATTRLLDLNGDDVDYLKNNRGNTILFLITVCNVVGEDFVKGRRILIRYAMIEPSIEGS